MFRTVTVVTDLTSAPEFHGKGWIYAAGANVAGPPLPWLHPSVVPEPPTPPPPPPPLPRGWLYSTQAPAPPLPPPTAYPRFVVRRPADPEPLPEVTQAHLTGWLYSSMAAPPAPPPATLPSWFRPRSQGVDTDYVPVERETSSKWHPGIVSPSPTATNPLGRRIVPRVPIRLQNGDQKEPVKIDPRLVRFTEVVQEVLNDLLAGATIVKTSNGYVACAMPRQIAPSEALLGEQFFDTSTLRLRYRDPSGGFHNLY